jgi:hypothetical protein
MNTNDESDNHQPSTKVPLWLKILLSMIIVIILIFSIGYKIDFFKDYF